MVDIATWRARIGLHKSPMGFRQLDRVTPYSPNSQWSTRTELSYRMVFCTAIMCIIYSSGIAIAQTADNQNLIGGTFRELFLTNFEKCVTGIYCNTCSMKSVPLSTTITMYELYSTKLLHNTDLTICGDIEANPGPKPSNRPEIHRLRSDISRDKVTWLEDQAQSKDANPEIEQLQREVDRPERRGGVRTWSQRPQEMETERKTTIVAQEKDDEEEEEDEPPPVKKQKKAENEDENAANGAEAKQAHTVPEPEEEEEEEESSEQEDEDCLFINLLTAESPAKAEDEPPLVEKQEKAENEVENPSKGAEAKQTHTVPELVEEESSEQADEVFGVLPSDDTTEAPAKAEGQLPEDVLDVCEKDIRQNMVWLKQATYHQKTLLRNFLVNLDKSKRIDFSTVRSRAICDGLHEIMMRICKKMKEIDPRLNGNLVRVGSAQNGTKIDDLKEFDYVYELLERFRNDDDDDDDLFNQILSKSMQELELPPGWCHGGFNRPKFSGIRMHRVARLLQFDYLESSDKDPLRLSVDFVLMIRNPIDARYTGYRLNPLDEFLLKKTGVEHCWFSPGTYSYYLSNAEKLWLDEYPSDSMAKRLIRIGKYFTVLFKMNKKCPIFKENLEVYREMSQDNSNLGRFKFSPAYDSFLFDTNEYVTYSDLGEIAGDLSLIKSYAFKKIVMFMMMASESHGHDWTEDDLPDLVICLYMALVKNCSFNTEIHTVKSKFVENKIVVPLENMSELNEDLVTENRETKLNLKFTQKCLKWFRNNELSELYTLEYSEYPLYCSKLSNVFQLLRNVCEGHNTAEIIMHEPLLPKGYFVKEFDYVQKRGTRRT